MSFSSHFLADSSPVVVILGRNHPIRDNWGRVRFPSWKISNVSGGWGKIFSSCCHFTFHPIRGAGHTRTLHYFVSMSKLKYTCHSCMYIHLIWWFNIICADILRVASYLNYSIIAQGLEKYEQWAKCLLILYVKQSNKGFLFHFLSSKFGSVFCKFVHPYFCSVLQCNNLAYFAHLVKWRNNGGKKWNIKVLNPLT